MGLTDTQKWFYEPHILAAVEVAKEQTIELLGENLVWDGTDEDRRWALEITVRACYALAQQFPNQGFGLESYEGVSGVAYRAGGPRYSFDIILCSPDGPSNDILAGGLTPISTQWGADDYPASNWARDWRAPEVPTGDIEPPPPPPPPPPPTGDIAEVLRQLARIDVKLDRVMARQDRPLAPVHGTGDGS